MEGSPGTFRFGQVDGKLVVRVRKFSWWRDGGRPAVRGESGAKTGPGRVRIRVHPGGHRRRSARSLSQRCLTSDTGKSGGEAAELGAALSFLTGLVFRRWGDWTLVGGRGQERRSTRWDMNRGSMILGGFMAAIILQFFISYF